MSDTKNDNVIYIIRNDLDLPEYVGISNNVEKRFHRGHCRKITQHEIDNKKKITLIREAINTHGKDHFWYEILHKGSREDCLNLEDGFIKKHKTLKPDGFNQVPGGGNPPSWKGKKRSKATIDKLRIAWTGNQYAKGKKMPPRSKEHIEKLRIASTGKKSSQESKDKISETCRIKRFNKIIESYSK